MGVLSSSISRQKGFCLRRWSAEPCLIKWVIKQTIISLLFFVPLPSLYLPVPSQGRDTRGIPVGYPSDTHRIPGIPMCPADTRHTRDTHAPRASRRFLVRLSVFVWAPRGLVGPGFGLPWPAGGQVGWPSRWDHFSGPGGRTAPRVPFPRVRFRPLCREGCKSGPHDAGRYEVPYLARGRGAARPARRKKKRLSYRPGS